MKNIEFTVNVSNPDDVLSEVFEELAEMAERKEVPMWLHYDINFSSHSNNGTIKYDIILYEKEFFDNDDEEKSVIFLSACVDLNEKTAKVEVDF